MGEPTRTCIGCRRRAPRAALLRLVRDSAEDLVRLDPAKSAPGRGAHLHDDPTCFALAVRRRAIGRALRLTGAVVLAPELLARYGDAAAGSDSTAPGSDHTPEPRLGESGAGA